MLLALESKLDRTQDSLMERMNDINKFMDLIKIDLDKELEEQEKQLLKTISKCNVCEARIDSIEKQLKDYSPKSGNMITDLDGREALKGLKQLEILVNKLKEDVNKRLSIIDYNELPKKANLTDLEELEKKLRDKVNKSNSHLIID